jgi:hypothetical protein
MIHKDCERVSTGPKLIDLMDTRGLTQLVVPRPMLQDMPETGHETLFRKPEDGARCGLLTVSIHEVAHRYGRMSLRYAAEALREGEVQRERGKIGTHCTGTTIFPPPSRAARQA